MSDCTMEALNRRFCIFSCHPSKCNLQFLLLKVGKSHFSSRSSHCRLYKCQLICKNCNCKFQLETFEELWHTFCHSSNSRLKIKKKIIYRNGKLCIHFHSTSKDNLEFSVECMNVQIKHNPKKRRKSKLLNLLDLLD